MTVTQVSEEVQQLEEVRPSPPPIASESAAQVRSRSSAMREAFLPAVPLEGLPLRRFTLDEYHQLINIGFFDEDERVELLEGVLVYMSPIHPLHSNTVDLLAEIFGEIVTRGATRVRTQGPISILETESEPEPDLIVFRVPGVDFALRHPSQDEVLLVMEVADSSLAHDRTHKATVYAQAGIRDYWIWNLVDRSLEVYRDPHTSSTGEALYQTKLTFHHGTSVAALAFPDHEVAVDDVLPAITNEG